MPRMKQSEPVKFAIKNDDGSYFNAGSGWGTLSQATLYMTRAKAGETAGILREAANGIRVVMIALRDTTDEQPEQPAAPAA